ncbi:MAG: MBL fold metallo-hydrolase, partial [Chthoniobacterales bacterium]
MPIPFSRSKRNLLPSAEKAATPTSHTKVGLRPSADWHKRNFLTSVLIPSLFTKRAGKGGLP